MFENKTKEKDRDLSYTFGFMFNHKYISQILKFLSPFSFCLLYSCTHASMWICGRVGFTASPFAVKIFNYVDFKY